MSGIKGAVDAARRVKTYAVERGRAFLGRKPREGGGESESEAAGDGAAMTATATVGGSAWFVNKTVGEVIAPCHRSGSAHKRLLHARGRVFRRQSRLLWWREMSRG